MKTANKWLTLLLAIVMIASIGLAGCGNDSVEQDNGTNETPGADGQEEAPNEDVKLDATQVLNYDLGSEPTSLDSSTATYSHDFELLNNVLEGLARIDLNNEIKPAMAEKWEVSEDQLKYTFTLRDAKWSNGDAVTAGDFEFAWKLAMNPKTGAEYQGLFDVAGIAGAKEVAALSADSSDEELNAALTKVGVKAVDAKTLEVTLSRPSALLLELTTFPTFFPINQKYYESLEPGAFGTDADKLIYNGPFVVSEWNHDNSIKLVKNDNYWDAETVKLNEVNYAMITDTNTRFNLYLSGDLDATGIPEQFLEQYKDDENAVRVTETVNYWLYLNLKGKGDQGEFLRNDNFRKAVAIGFNRQQLIDVVYGGTKVPAYGIVPPGISGSAEGKDFRDEFTANNDIIKEDVEKAKELIQKAKEDVGKEIPSFTLLMFEGDKSLKMAQIMQEQWKQIGVNVEVNQQPAKVSNELKKNFNYDIAIGGWGADYNDASTFMDLFTSDNPFNQMGFNAVNYDKAVSDAANETDRVKRAQLYADAEKILLENGSLVPIFYQSGYSLRQPYVKDIARYASGPDYSLKWAYISGKE